MSGLAWRSDGPPDAPPLVLLNSIASTTEIWTPTLAPLIEEFRVVRIDYRGHGASPKAQPGGGLTLADIGTDVLAVLDELGVDRVHLAGVSLGGMIGMWLAARHPERIARLALICTSAQMPPAQGWLDRAATVRAEGMSAVAGATVGRWLTPALVARDPGLVADVTAMIMGVDGESYAQCCEVIGAMDQRADLGRIAAPTLVVVADQDPSAPRPHGELLAAGIAGSRLEVLSDAAHVPTLERPGALALLLLDHFRAAATLATGYRIRRAVLGDAHVDRARAGTTSFTAPFQEFLTRYAWGDIWSRPELNHRDRSIATLAALVALGAENELAMHVRAARRNGLTDDEIREVIMHVTLYAGLPRVNAAMAIAQAALASE